MVLNDVVKEYEQLNKVLEKFCGEESLVGAGLRILTQYNSRCNNAVNNYVKSAMNGRDETNLLVTLRELVGVFSSDIAVMNNNVRNTMHLISEIEKIEFKSGAVEKYALDICACLEQLLDLVEAYASNKIEGKGINNIFFSMIDKLSEFEIIYKAILSNYDFLRKTEEELLEVNGVSDNGDLEEHYLEIRSTKKSTKINTCSDDISLLNECLNLFEQIISGENSTPIYMLKVESGSLFSKLKSENINISILPSIVKNFADAMHTFRMTGAEVEHKKSETEVNLANADKIRAETEKIRIENKGTKLEIVNSRLADMMQLLHINEEDNESKELLVRFGISLLDYMEANPQGEMNEIKYDISECVKLLEKKDEDRT